MNESRQLYSHRESLLSQDQDVSTFRFDEFRRNLESAIATSQRRARTVRMLALSGLGVFVVCIILVAVTEFTGMAELRWVRGMLYGSGVLVMFMTGVLACLYQYKYAPFLTRAKEKLSSLMMTELQKQVADLQSDNDIG